MGSLLGLWLLTFAATELRADPMIGDVGAAVASPETTMANPANVVFMDRSQIGGSADFLRSEKRYLRFPRSEPTMEEQTGPGIPLSYQLRPALVLRPSPWIGLSGFAVPPLLALNMKFKNIPLVVLKSRNSVDLDAHAKVNFMGSGAVGLRLGEKVGIGVGGEYRSLTINADITESSSKAYIGQFKGKVSGLDSIVGIRFDPKPGQLAFGIAATVLSVNQQSFDVSTVLDAEGGERFGSSTLDSKIPLSRVLIGAQVGLGRLKLLGDVRFTRFDHEAKVFSIVDFREKKREVYETVAPALGAVLNVTKGTNLLVGFKYEPTPIGPGSRDTAESEGLAGFGTLDLSQELLGVSQTSPYYPGIPFWQFATGLQMSLMPETAVKKDNSGQKETPARFYHLTLGAGFGYRQASLGIDENGEQPGAYLIKRMFVPMLAIWRF